MQKSLVKFQEADREAIIASISAAAFKDALEKIEKASDTESGTFRVIISTDDRDRQGEIVSIDGWDLSFYKMNPVVLWAHDYWSAPIGKCTKIDIEVIDGKRCLVAEGKFAPTDEGQQYRKLYDGKFLTTTSVGFMPKEFDNDTGTITKQELLEFSFVPVPANPFAVSLAMAKELGLDLPMIARKGMSFTLSTEVKNAKKDADTKADQIGDSCELPDGTPGILAEDPKNPEGALICVPTESKAAKDGSDEDDDGDEDTGGEDEDDDFNMDLDDDLLDDEGKDLVKGLTKKMTKEHNRHSDAVRKFTDDMEEKMGELEDEQDGKSVATCELIKSVHTLAIDDFRQKMVDEHLEHMKCMKSIIKEYVENMGKMMKTVRESGKSVADLPALVKTITEATGTLEKLLKGTGGENTAEGAEAAAGSEKDNKAAEAPQGSPKQGSKNVDGELSDYLAAKHIIRSLHEATTIAIENFNKRGKKYARGKK